MMKRGGNVDEARVHHARARSYEAEIARARRGLACDSVDDDTFGANEAPEVGSEINGYLLESVLGQGGMGTVYLARGPEGGVCAVKVLSRRLVGGDPSFATRFKREVQYAEALDHPHVLELYEAGETPDGTLFFAMQYVDGQDTRRLAAAGRRVEPLRRRSPSSGRSAMRWTARTRTASSIAT